MLFNTYEFWLFFIPVLAGTHLVSHKYQNYYLLLASYIFYASWDWRFLSLIIFSTFTAYLSGILASPGNSEKTRRNALFITIVVNLSILGFFKYADFFIGSLIDLFSLPDSSKNDLFLNIILPVGISFYTFQAISYTVDIYRGKIDSDSTLADVALYVSFFPQLVAGPIERGSHLIPQIRYERSINRRFVESGIYLIVWGLFKKVCIADSLSHPVNAIFDSQSSMGLEVYLGIFLFSIQIYCDFSGYSDIARGLARLLGFDLMLNFNLPYFARNPSEFWRRWHISLSTWLRDYLYIPLGGNRNGSSKTYRNLMLTMILGGLWHGARYNFLLWGFYQGLLLALHRYFTSNLNSKEIESTGSSHWIRVFGMFQLTLLGWLLFRVENMHQLKRMFIDFFYNWSSVGASVEILLYSTPLILPLLLMQVWQYKNNNLEIVDTLSWPSKVVFVAFCISSVLFLNRADGTPFIYFQF